MIRPPLEPTSICLGLALTGAYALGIVAASRRIGLRLRSDEAVAGAFVAIILIGSAAYAAERGASAVAARVGLEAPSMLWPGLVALCVAPSVLLVLGHGSPRPPWRTALRWAVPGVLLVGWGLTVVTAVGDPLGLQCAYCSGHRRPAVDES